MNESEYHPFHVIKRRVLSADNLDPLALFVENNEDGSSGVITLFANDYATKLMIDEGDGYLGTFSKKTDPHLLSRLLNNALI